MSLVAQRAPAEAPKSRLRRWADEITRDVYAIALAARDPRVPWYAKAIAIVIATYALSPIDLIPDFIPVLGFLDELILLPVAIAGVVYLIDPRVMAEHRVRAAQMAERPTSALGAALIVALWLTAIGLIAWWIFSAR